MGTLARWVSVATLAGALAATSVAGQDRVHALATELRCPVCQNQNLADSNAELAIDLRREIARQVAAGRSDDEIRRFMVQRYGHYVLYDPPLMESTSLLWAAPGLLLALGGALVWRRLARMGKDAVG
jgi:cytochrome c-type biogenesis protein CcmH